MQINPEIDPSDAPLVDVVRFNLAADRYSIARLPVRETEQWPLRPGFTCLVDHATRQPVRGPFEYLLSLHDNDCSSIATIRSYAYALRPAVEALYIEGRPYEYLDDDVLTSVVSSLIEGKGKRGEAVEASTVEFYVSAVGRCADFTNQKGMTSIELDLDAHISRGWKAASLLRDGGSRLDPSSVLGARKSMIRPLSRPTIERIEARMLMDPDKWHPSSPSSRPGMTFSNGRRLGLRLNENLGLMHEEVMRRTVVDPDREYQLEILRTKGADYRVIFPLGCDILRWQAYARRERASCVARAREVHGSNWDEPAQLLVNGLSSGVHVGAAVQPSSIQRDFRTVQERLGMSDKVEFVDENGVPRSVTVMWHCYHDLRHSYAQAMYRVARLRNDHFADDPVGFVQLRLGHRDRATTSRIYLWPDLRKIRQVGDHAVAGLGALIDA
ncbi:hypothetical protein NF701_09025 [Sphingomonadaceae bacterium OTU29THOMA1]|nr:hypothetical protein NF701_09025 [Sphingomonadaceae bacterium OTU29THOMA1]